MTLSDALGVLALGIVGALVVFAAFTGDYAMAIVWSMSFIVVGVVAMVIENKKRPKHNW